MKSFVRFVSPDGNKLRQESVSFVKPYAAAC